MNSYTPLLSLHDIGYQVGDAVLLNHISFALDADEMISIIGPNGAGKSTLVKIILGLKKPTMGTMSNHAHVVGYVPQRFSVPSILPLQVRDLLAQADRKRLALDQQHYIYDKLSLIKLFDRQVQHLSGGEMQRVLMARSLLDKPELLILDEPMQGLDPDSEHLLYQFIDAMPTFLRCAMIVVSHDLHWVMKGTRHVICLNNHICCQGVPSQIAAHSGFTSLFGHYQAPYIHHHDHSHL